MIKRTGAKRCQFDEYTIIEYNSYIVSREELLEEIEEKSRATSAWKIIREEKRQHRLKWYGDNREWYPWFMLDEDD